MCRWTIRRVEEVVLPHIEHVQVIATIIGEYIKCPVDGCKGAAIGNQRVCVKRHKAVLYWQERDQMLRRKRRAPANFKQPPAKRVRL